MVNSEIAAMNTGFFPSDAPRAALRLNGIVGAVREGVR
jgi:hypothetical protein